MSGGNRNGARREKVWEALNAAAAQRRGVPGCEELGRISATELHGTVKAKVGPVKATFSGKVTLSELNPPHSYVISGEGTGGVAGFAKGGDKVTLEEDGEETVLRYVAKATVGGKLAQIGSRLIVGVSRKMADQFFTAFVEIVAPGSAEKADED